MTRVLVRLARRLASWENDLPVSEIQKYEFRDRNTGGPDLHPSIYEIDDTPGDVCRAYAEHIAAVPLDPARETLGICCDGSGHSVVANDGSPKFEFIRGHHREVELPDETALSDFIALLKHRVSSSRVRRATRTQIVSYAKARVAARDAEWMVVVRETETKDWLCKLALAEEPG